MNTPKVYLTGGTVRDHLLGAKQGNDVDFAVEADSFESMLAHLAGWGFMAWQTRPEFVTVRGTMPRFPVGSFGGLLDHLKRDTLDCDFTLCRVETQYSDRRHPDTVTPGTLEQDLARRDFTVNAVAVTLDGSFVDPFDGVEHAKHRHLRTVGHALDRFDEDPLRMLRAFRFVVTKDMTPANSLVEMLWYCSAFLGPGTVPVERVREEFAKAFNHNWFRSMSLLNERGWCHLASQVAAQYPSLNFKPTLEA